MKKLLIMAAGTGGHIFPGLAIAATMRQRGWQVSWLGTTHGMEGDLVPQHDIEMDRITFSGMRGKGLAHTLRGAWRLLASFPACFNFIGRRKPDVVLGMGGYVTVPGGVMARLRGVPLVLVNADAALLLSNKLLAPLARRVLFGLPTEFVGTADKALVTGNPVRQEIMQLPLPEQRYSGRIGPLRLLVVGGSLGAKALNDCMPAALALMPVAVRPSVTHQSGKQHIAALQAAYKVAGVVAEVVAFIDDMPRRYADADLVVCRAGAITVSELTAAGVASVLIPFVASTTSHQRDNARWMATKEAAIHLKQSDLSKERLSGLLTRMTRHDCQLMAQAAYEIGRRDANQSIAQVLEECASPESSHET
ncbi:undecaprenyldiphospho-muramoylpentapeptide beta-N-acetylglucosaminyltransferase [Glaciimonas immobilis]|uniref:UDP-N-acetylglucosamine--N-acetylmuramyl-(pentapeptide) pyrophosphoryl-undecaprenol N-acetylglucosamine transferase n=1 Tax=Glaciimonas immobilis TaxID=728004 RepID=A0A840RU25_9BURK|nr:undecaprenyldiphospho-muramoylpentapeptide beta-N-acetylglucosaminyltransferase [Glaciimonas immobilis]KAF3999672.1 undecaprenyldiphospho-muramoylpentapeptide beta-N-acetylglucosaminyltransferase [Glaciimonas immobilis]MBB5200111.1 UDP-N-acetylglucosamine--N-acetylmuramyl-(pentapeptide) pyrophosphoryl-undecaprenol N-acetylglucosamine transferase [Glaciimonas immobilis]